MDYITQSNKRQILVVNDDAEYRSQLVNVLTPKYHVQITTETREVVSVLLQQNIDLVVLGKSVSHCREGGLKLLRNIKDHPSLAEVPVILIGNSEQKEEWREGLLARANDYLTKSLGHDLLLMRIAMQLEKHPGTNLGQQTLIEDAVIRWARQEVAILKPGATHESEEAYDVHHLTPKQIDILRLFIANPGRTWSRQEILDKVWIESFVSDRNVDTHVKSLRQKIPSLKSKIKGIYGTGYRFDP